MGIVHTFRTKSGQETRSITPLRAIRLQCLECMCWDKNEVVLCQSPLCSLYPWRTGKAVGSGRKMSSEQKAAAEKRLASARAKKDQK